MAVGSHHAYPIRSSGVIGDAVDTMTLTSIDAIDAEAPTRALPEDAGATCTAAAHRPSYPIHPLWYSDAHPE